MADQIVSWGGFNSKGTEGMGVTGSFQVSSSANSFFVGGGNVGIGTPTPSASIHISGSSGSVLFEIDSPAVNNILFVSGSGNVGIGTGNPTYALEVSGSGGNQGVIRSRRLIAYGGTAGDPAIATDSTIAGLFEISYAQLGFSSYGGEAGRIETNARLWNIGMTGGTAKMNIRGTGATSVTTAFRVENANASGSMVVLDNGFVGINTGSAQYNLDVNGDGRFKGIYSPILNSEGALSKIINPQGAQLSNGTATSTGVIKFKIPSVVGNNYSNYGFVVQIGSQGGFLSETFIQARWIVSDFDRLEAYTLGRNFKIRVGTDGTDQYLLIGETDSAWYRTNITLREFYVDYSYKDIDTLKEGWEVSFDTDISDITINRTVANSDYAQQFFGYLQLTGQTFATSSWNTIATLDTLSGTGTFLLKRIDQGLLNFTVADSYGSRILKLNYLTQLSSNLYQGIRITTDNKVQVLIGTSYNSSNDIYVFNSKGVTLTNATASGAETVDKVITFNSLEEGEITTDPLTVRNNFTVTGSTVLKGSGTTSSTTAFQVQNANATNMLSLTDNGALTINTFQTSSTAFTINRTLTSMGNNFNLATMGNLVTINDTVGNSNAAKTSVYINTTGASQNNALIVENGSVGFGTTSPGSGFTSNLFTTLGLGLRVNRASNYQITSRDTTQTFNTAHGGGISFWGGSAGQGEASSAYAGIRGLKANNTYLNSLGSLAFYIQTGSSQVVDETTFREIARFNSSGSFGIGTTTPSASLHVSGAILNYPITLPTSSGTASMDCSQSNFFNLTLSGSSILFLSASNIQPGQTVNLRVTQPATSGSLNYGSQFKFAGGIPYSASATGSAVDIISFISFDTTTLYGSAIKNLS